MHTVTSERLKQQGYRFVASPEHGVLRLRGAAMGVGSVFTQHDINTRQVTYTHLGNIGAKISANDSFSFVLFDQQGDITDPDRYNPCMPDQPFAFPENGVFVMPIHITSKGYIVANPQLSSLHVTQGGSSVLQEGHTRVEGVGVADSDLLYLVIHVPQRGVIQRRGVPVTAFTQQDISENTIVYNHTANDSLNDSFKLQVQNSFSKSVYLDIPVIVESAFAATGDNVFYAAVNGQAAIQLTANRNNAVWRLVNGVTQSPDGGMAPVDHEFASWSLHGNSDEFPSNDPRQGSGYNKLPQFRNFIETNYWQGGLPLGVKLNSSGSLSNSIQQPEPEKGTLLWTLPDKPTAFTWQAQAIDPVSGNTFTRRYFLHVTQTGFGLDGQTSERND